MAFDALKKYMEEQGMLEASEAEISVKSREGEVWEADDEEQGELYEAAETEAGIKPSIEDGSEPSKVEKDAGKDDNDEPAVKDDDEKTEEELDAEWYELLLGTHF